MSDLETKTAYNYTILQKIPWRYDWIVHLLTGKHDDDVSNFIKPWTDSYTEDTITNYKQVKFKTGCKKIHIYPKRSRGMGQFVRESRITGLPGCEARLDRFWDTIIARHRNKSIVN